MEIKVKMDNNDYIEIDDIRFKYFYKKTIYDDKIIVFDANVLLNMYFINPNDLIYWGYYLDILKEQIWTPYQVYKEFESNRVEKINQIRDMIADLRTVKKISLEIKDNIIQ